MTATPLGRPSPDFPTRAVAAHRRAGRASPQPDGENVDEIKPFTFPATGQPVRAVLIDGEPWSLAADICAVLAIVNVSQAVASLDDDEKMQVSPNLFSTEVGGRDPWFINESGLYSLILRSRKPQAKAFKRWITHEVLPSIRRDGSYSAPDAAVPVSINVTVVNALAQLAHRQHVVPMAGRVLAYERWNKPAKGIEAYVQLTINLNLPGLDGAPAEIRALLAKDVA